MLFLFTLYHFFLNSRYTEIANNFQKEETVLNIDFVMLDCSPLKFALLSHCNEWQNKFTTLLREMASQKLSELHNFLKDNAKKYVLYKIMSMCVMIIIIIATIKPNTTIIIYKKSRFLIRWRCMVQQ